MALRIAEKAALSDVGRARQSNEDSYLERSPLFVVADGMGGARAGEVASAIAVETAKDSDVGASPEQDLAGVVKAANAEIYRKAQEILIDESPHITLCQPYKYQVVRNRVKDMYVAYSDFNSGLREAWIDG